MVNIREANGEDLPVVYGLLKEFAAYLGESDKMTISLDDLTGCKELYKCLLAEATDGREAMGCALFYYIFDSWAGKVAYIDALYVGEKFRGHQVGKHLMKSLAALAKQNGCHRLEWTVREDNSNAIEFYRKLGASVGDDRLNCAIEL